VKRFQRGDAKERFRVVVGAVLALAATTVVITTVSAASGTDTITTLAGTGVAGFSGDTGQASAAQLNSPRDVAADAAGNVYIADRTNNRVRKVSPAGVITTFAGTGVLGFSGDTGQASAAQLNRPEGVAVDAAGNVYIADSSNHRVRKVDTAGVITTFAGTGVPGFSGDTGQASAAQLNFPIGVAADGAGNVYIGDTDNHRVRKVSPAGVITTLAGTGVAGFSGDTGQASAAQLDSPRGVAVDGAGNVYIGDFFNHRVRKVNPAGVITTLAGTGVPGFSGDTGQASAAQLRFPRDVAADAAGNVYIADGDNHRVRKVDPAGVITTLAGTGVQGFSGDTGQAALAQLRSPRGVAADPIGTVYIADTNNHRVRKVSAVAPTAAFSANPTSGNAPLTVSFDASASSDPNGTIVSYAWAFGDTTNGTGATVSHTYSAAGTFTATLTVTDNDGATGQLSQTITVTGAAGGGGGACTITGNARRNTLNGTPGPDVICGLGGADVINGRGGADVIRGGRGADVLRGGPGPDRLLGGRGADVLRGGRAADVANGGPGADICTAERRISC
jgi:PKD domain/RTX calcium-binding nonapeptide repeat (4 copies)/NHL repeat